MNGIGRKITALCVAFSMLSVQGLPQISVFAENGISAVSYEAELFAAGDVYTCDFSQLVKNNAQTVYGTSGDIIKLDDYTTAYLTYEGTYVDTDAKLYLKGTNGGKGAYTNGSYIEFTAPVYCEVKFTGNAMNYFVDGSYKSYGSSGSVTLEEGQKLQIGQRTGATAVYSLTYSELEVVEDLPAASEYTSPSTIWDFGVVSPALEGYNRPVISGNAVSSPKEGEIQFPSDTTAGGTLKVEFENPVKNTEAAKNNVKFTFDVTGHTKALGQQYINYSIKNSDGGQIVSHSIHPYDSSAEGSTVLSIGGAEAASGETVNISGAATTKITVAVDYYARKVTVTIGDKTPITGEIPEEMIRDVKSFEFTVTRSKTAGDRYVSVDNLTIEEFTSTEQAAPEAEIASGYTAGEYNGMPYRIAVPAEEGNYPLVVYLHSSSRNGNDNASQLYQAQYIFDVFKDSCIVAAPQTADSWSADTLAGFIDSIENADTDKVYIAGQNTGTDAALALAAAYPDKIAAVISVGGTSVLTDAQVSALSGANTAVYAFSQYGDAEKVRANINKLQSSGMTEVTYTEYPYEQSNIAEVSADTTGLKDWLLGQSVSENAEEKTASRVVDLAIFMGQSNMAGRGDYNEAIKCETGHGFEYHSVTEPGVLTTVSEPFGKYENNDTVHDAGSNGVDRRSGDMVSAFMESYYQTSGTPIVGVQCSRGGTESRWWNNSTILTEASARYNEAKAYLEANGYTIGKKFMVWCQGESDADSNRGIDTYKSNTTAIFNTMKTNTGLTDMFIIRIGHRSGDDTIDARYKAINLAQKELAEETDGITAVASFYTDECYAQMRDAYHYYQPAYNSVGTIAGNNTAYTLYAEGEWTEYPEPAIEADATPVPVEGVFEVTSSDGVIDVSTLRMYDNTTYRMYKADGSYETVTATDGKVSNTTGGEVVIVPEHKFEFTNQTNPTDENIAGYVKVAQGSYTEEKGYGLTSADYSINANGCRVDTNPIKIELAEGFYDVTVYRLGGGRADIYANSRLIANNTTSTSSQNRGGGFALMEIPSLAFDDGVSDITFGNLSGNNERIASLKVVRVPEKFRKPVIWVAGDSESANYYPCNANGDDLDSDKIMMTGFGQQLDKVLSDKYAVSNYGQPSATVRTWYDECFDAVNTFMQAGDTILIDFGINDAVSSSNKMTVDEMKVQMKLIIDAAKAKNVTPILVSPVYNGKYQNKSYFRYNADSKTNDMYAFAEENDVRYIDLNKWTQLYINSATEATGDTSWITNNYHIADNLHLTQHSAVLAASIIAAGMYEMGYEVSDYAYTYSDISAVLEGNVRGEETGVKRVYSASALAEFMGIKIKEPAKSVEIDYNSANDRLTLTSTGAPLEAAVVVEASYNTDGTVNNINIYSAEFADNKATIENIEIYKNEKLYVWESFESMKPLAETYVGEELAPTPTPTVTTEPIVMIYEQDFESYSEAGGNSGIADGWSSPAGKASVKTDSTSGINRYMAITGGNAARSGYFNLSKAVSENFVFEADLKTVARSDRVSELQLVEVQKSVYQNHGVENTAKYVFTMDRPRGEDLYVINNGISDSGLALADYNQPPVVTGKISGDPWIHVKVVGNFETGRVITYVTSLDGKTEYYHGMSDMSEGIKSFQCIHVLGPANGVDTCIDNIKLYKARTSDLAPTYHKVTLTCKAYTFDQYVLSGESVVNIPDVSAYGDSFEGWNIDGKLYTREELSKQPVTRDCEIVGQVNDSYIEAMASVEFNSFPAGNELVMGSDENTAGDNPFSLTITGEQGTSLITNPDERVTDYNVEWTFDGFRTIDGRETGETGSSYCEGYAELKATAEHNTAVNFAMKRTAANYYGRVTAKVTYNGKQMSVTKPLILLGDKSGDDILPRAGYTADYNKYEESMTGYVASQNDIVLGGWQTYGSDSTRVELKKDSSGKYLALSRAASGNSSAVYNTIGDITGQTVFEQDVRFGIDGSISYIGISGKATAVAPSFTAFTLEKSGSSIKFNGTGIYQSVSADKWYHIVINADSASKKCFAELYTLEADGDYTDSAPIAKSGLVDFSGGYTSGSAYRISPSKNNSSSVDINNVRIYTAEIDEATIVVTAPETANIPESGEASVNLSVVASTLDGNSAIGLVEWKIDDEFAEGVSIEGTADNEATLKIASQATSGDLPIRVTIGGKSKIIYIKLLGTKDNVAFTQAPAGIQLGADGEYKFTAVVRNGQAETVADRSIAYSITDESESVISPDGISISADGTLSISETAQPQTIYIKAESVDRSGNAISRTVRTVLYTLDFSFGTGEAKEGFTNVSAERLYSESLGFGVDVGATESADGISGATFRLKLEKGKVYSVTAIYQGEITCERIDSALSGFVRTKDTMGEDTYKVAVFGDDVMDIAISGTLKLISVEEVAKTAADKPDWWTIGDSTIQQNGSWAYALAAAGLSGYPELESIIGTFHNSGRAGRQHKSFYSEGLFNNILCGMNPGDVVSISGMGTNDSSSTFEQFKAYSEIYMNAIIDMGGYVILGSYTPSGNYGETSGKVYDADNMQFKGMRTNAYDRAIRELYAENADNPEVLGFIDIGKMSDNKMTADVQGVYNSAIESGADEAAAREAANARAEEMMLWWRDYNHYNATFSNYILSDIIAAVVELIDNMEN